MTELFESTIDNVSDMDIKGYTGPDEIDQNLEIWVKSGKEEYIYKFHGPGVKKVNAIANKLENVVPENERLKEAYEKLHAEKEDLKKENEEFSNQILDYIEMNRKLSEENKKEVHKVKEIAADNDRLENKIRDLQVDNKFLKRQVNKTAEAVKNFQKEIAEMEKAKKLVETNMYFRSDILEQAKKCVCGHREQDYGTPESNFQLIADLWNQYLFKEPGAKEIFGIGPMDVSMMMALMKIARIRNGGGSGDSFVDLAGYAACGGEIWHGERHSDK